MRLKFQSPVRGCRMQFSEYDMPSEYAKLIVNGICRLVLLFRERGLQQLPEQTKVSR